MGPSVTDSLTHKCLQNYVQSVGKQAVSYSSVLQQDLPPLPPSFATVLIHSFRVRLS